MTIHARRISFEFHRRRRGRPKAKAPDRSRSAWLEAEAEGEEAGQRVASQAPLSIVVFVFVVASEEGEKECCASDSQAPKPGRQPSAAEEDLDQAWTKEQREEVTAKKAQEAEAAASVGLRRSPRARVPTEKVLK